MNVQQLSVFLENKPGRLQKILQVLKSKKINILTLTIAEFTDFGIVRFILDKPAEAHEALKVEKITCTISEVLGIAIGDEPGDLSKLIDCIYNNGLNIEYMYAFTEKHEGRPIMLMRFENIEEAKKLLLKEGFEVIKKSDIIGDNK